MLKYINDIIKSGSTGNVKIIKGKTLKQLLQDQAYYLQGLIQKYLRDYRIAFKPERYRRGMDWSLENSVKVSPVTHVNGVPVIYVYFDENAVHRSGFGVWSVRDGRGKYDDDIHDSRSYYAVNTAVLINEGYRVEQDVWFKDLPDFGYRNGAHFVEKAIKEFNSTNSLRIRVDVNNDIIKGYNMREW